MVDTNKDYYQNEKESNNNQKRNKRRYKDIGVHRPIVSTLDELAIREGESLDEYLTWACGRLDILRNDPEKKAQDPVLSKLTQQQIDDFVAYVCDLIADEIWAHARWIGKVLSVNRDKDYYCQTAYGILFGLVFENLHRFNKKELLNGRRNYKFTRFVGNYEAETIRNILSVDRDQNDYYLKRIKAVYGAKRRIISRGDMNEKMIRAEEIYEELAKNPKNKLSLKTIKTVMKLVEGNKSLDYLTEEEVKKLEERYIHDEEQYKRIENASFSKDLEELLARLRPVQAYVLLKRATYDRVKGVYEQLAEDPRVFELCKDDSMYDKRLKKIHKMKNDEKMRQELIELVESIYRSAQEKVRGYVATSDLSVDDLKGGWLNDWIFEQLDKY